MNRLTQHNDTMETIYEIERSSRYTAKEKEFWPIRLLLEDISLSLATLADEKEKGDGCTECKFVDRTTEQEPCCRCSNNYQNMWSGRK